MAELEPQPCPACGAPVVSATDERGRSALIDAAPSRDGTLSLVPTWDGKLRAVVPTAKLAFGRTDLHVLHTSRCSQLNKLKALYVTR